MTMEDPKDVPGERDDVGVGQVLSRHVVQNVRAVRWEMAVVCERDYMARGRTGNAGAPLSATSQRPAYSGKCLHFTCPKFRPQSTSSSSAFPVKFRLSRTSTKPCQPQLSHQQHLGLNNPLD